MLQHPTNFFAMGDVQIETGLLPLDNDDPKARNNGSVANLIS